VNKFKKRVERHNRHIHNTHADTQAQRHTDACGPCGTNANTHTHTHTHTLTPCPTKSLPRTT
jgi:hypothetical protein